MFKKSGSLRIFAPQEIRNCVTIMYMMGDGTTCFVSACRILADSRIFRKTATNLFVIILLSAFSGAVAAAQEATGINFFDIAHSDAGSPTCWDNNKSYIYTSGSATFTACSTYYVPITSDYLVFTTKKPSKSSWNVDFELDWGHSVNFLRYGEVPCFIYALSGAQLPQEQTSP